MGPVSAAILCTGGSDVIRKEAWPFYRTSPVSAYVGSSKNLKDLKDHSRLRELGLKRDESEKWDIPCT